MSFTAVVSADVVGDGCDVLSAQPLGLVVGDCLQCENTCAQSLVRTTFLSKVFLT